MEISEIQREQAIYIVIDKQGEASYILKDELSTWIKDGSIEPGYKVLQATIHNVFQAKETVDLISVY